MISRDGYFITAWDISLESARLFSGKSRLGRQDAVGGLPSKGAVVLPKFLMILGVEPGLAALACAV